MMPVNGYGKRKSFYFIKSGCGVPLAWLLALIILTAPLDAATLKIRVIATSDIHSHLMNYDYYQDTTVDEYGLIKTAALIAREREGDSNTLLIDNGDLIQGSPLADAFYAARSTAKGHQVHPAIKMLNALHYDVANIGNHDLNFGVDSLQATIKEAKFPYIDANLFTKEGKNPFPPYVILTRHFKSDAGFAQTIKIGVLGLLPPQVMQWDRSHLEGKYQAQDMVEVATKLVPEMRRKGADIVILAAHTGIGATSDPTPAENAGWALARIEGVDAIIGGHTHMLFPDPQAKENTATMPEVNPHTGMIGKVPMVVPSRWGDHIGVIDLTLESSGKTWQVVASQSRLFGLNATNGSAMPPANSQLVKEISASHEATIAYLSGPLGELKGPLHSFFALLRDDPSVALIAKAQLWRAQKALAATPLATLPLLAASAPFRAGDKSADNYVNIKPGPITRRDVAGLYTFNNSLQVVKVTGAALREWLEMSAGLYNTIDPAQKNPQPLIDAEFPSYNFDVMSGVSYRIDVLQKPRYDKNGLLIHPESHRITALSYQEKPVKENDTFLVATNDYRAGGGGHFPGLNGSNIVVSLSETIPAILADYLSEQNKVEPSSGGLWRLAPFSAGGVVTFTTSAKSLPFAKDLPYLDHPTEGSQGFVTYQILTPAL